MSTTEIPTWRHPMIRLHHRRVERHLVPAGKAAAELGAPLDMEMIRKALGYRRWTFLRRLRRVGYPFGAIALVGAAAHGPACTPGGRLTLSPAECSSWFAYFDLGTPSSFFTLIGCTLAGIWITSAWKGDFIARCYRPLYGLLDLVTMAAAVATGEASDYTQAARLADKTTDIRQMFWELPGDVAKEFGHAGDIRAQMGDHAKRVLKALESDAAELAAEPQEAARTLGLHLTAVVGNLASGRFTRLLPVDELPETELDPDRIAGRYLVRASVKSALLVLLLCLTGDRFGLPTVGVLVGSLPAFVLTTYLMLLHTHGLAEASRLIRAMKEPIEGPNAASPAP
ncbi:hypothetical protein ACFC1D_05860 [Streptomyces vinaceus]|uniref:hypothetical protein n=1 Tax=Streptomyces vinaceus TaxID=1960 RepID=UPI0035D5AA46